MNPVFFGILKLSLMVRVVHLIHSFLGYFVISGLSEDLVRN